jgi:hypothetical protein
MKTLKEFFLKVSEEKKTRNDEKDLKEEKKLLYFSSTIFWPIRCATLENSSAMSMRCCM